jgi:hypothetical protein
MNVANVAVDFGFHEKIRNISQANILLSDVFP